MFTVSASSAFELSLQWTGQLGLYRQHRNDEHREALIEDTTRYCGLHLENDLSRSDYWSSVPLNRRVALLLYLVDRGMVSRRPGQTRYVFAVTEGAEDWVRSQPALAKYVGPTLELLDAVRQESARRRRPASPNSN